MAMTPIVLYKDAQITGIPLGTCDLEHGGDTCPMPWVACAEPTPSPCLSGAERAPWERQMKTSQCDLLEVSFFPTT